MAIFILIPITAFTYLILHGLLPKLLQDACSFKVKRLALVLAISGFLTGIWTGNFLHYEVSKEIRLIGLPLPHIIEKTEDSEAFTHVMPAWIRWIGQGVNPLFGAALFLLPIRIHFVVKEITDELPERSH